MIRARPTHYGPPFIKTKGYWIVKFQSLMRSKFLQAQWFSIFGFHALSRHSIEAICNASNNDTNVCPVCVWWYWALFHCPHTKPGTLGHLRKPKTLKLRGLEWTRSVAFFGVHISRRSQTGWHISNIWWSFPMLKGVTMSYDLRI